jgi:hypothetical protein
MKAATLLLLAAPFAAMAQPYYPRDEILPDRPYVSTLRVCEARNDTLWDRKALIDEDRRNLEREDRSIAGLRAQLDAERRSLNPADATAVAAYNGKSDTLNRWVETHNRRVAELNGAAALLNADTRDLLRYCDNLYMARR